MTDDEDERSLIIVEDPLLREGFAQIPNGILRNPDLTIGAKVTYGVLLSYAWQKDSCFPGHDAMARDMGAGKRSVIMYLQQLQDAGLIRIQRRGQGKTNIYTILRRRSAESALLDEQDSALLKVPILHPNNTQRKDSKKKTKISNFEGSKAPTPMKRVQPVTPEFKTTHPELWQAGCSGVAEFIRVVGRGLWTDEEMNVSQWRAHSDAAPKRRTEMGES